MTNLLPGWGNVATITLDPVKDQDGQQAQMRGAPAMKVLEFDTLNLVDRFRGARSERQK